MTGTLYAEDRWRFAMLDEGDFVYDAECGNCGEPFGGEPLGWRASARIDPYILPVLLCDGCTETYRPDLVEFRRLARLVAARGYELLSIPRDDGPGGAVVRYPPESEGRLPRAILGTAAEPLALADVEAWLGRSSCTADQVHSARGEPGHEPRSGG